MRRLPVLVAAVCMAAIVAALLIPQTAYSELLITVLFSLFGASYVLVGALIATRRSENPVGWLMLAIGVLMTIPVLVGAYAGYALLEDPSLPFGRLGAWVTSWIYVPALGGINLLALVFPEGRIARGFLTWTARISVAAWSVATVATAVTPGPIDGFPGVSNPVGKPALSGALDLALSGAAVVGVSTFLVAMGSVFVRVRRAQGPERQQLKWFAYATVVTVVGYLPNLLPTPLGETWVGLVGLVVALTAIPVGVALAILRARLYDIDRLISRTLVYGGLTATLVAAYSGSVLLFRVLLDPLTGGSDLAVAASTLAVAALFRPVRARIQEVVDRRFYRSRYDAARTVEGFTTRLRQEVDLDTVSADLSRVVRDAVQPTHVSLWLRAPEAPR